MTSVWNSTEAGEVYEHDTMKVPHSNLGRRAVVRAGWQLSMKIPEVARRARRRLLWNETLAQGTCAVSVGLGAVVLLLLLGTQILDWRWLVLLPLATLALGTWRTARRLPSAYATLQIVDRRLQLADHLSTALYFQELAGRERGADQMRRAQLERAEHLAAAIDLRRAIPFTMPRAIYAAGLLAFVASSLFALRYGLERRLELRMPLAHILLQSFGGSDTQLASLEKKKNAAAKRQNFQDALGISTPDAESKNAGELDAAPDSALDTIGVPDADNQKGNGATAGKGKTPASDQMDAEQSDGDAADEGEANSTGHSSGEGKQGATQTKSGQPNAGEDSSGSEGNNSSLVSKLRDAMSNLLSRMKQQPAGAGAQQVSAASQKGQSAGQKGAGQKGKSGQGQKQQGGQDADSQEGDPGEDAQSAQNAQGRGAGQSSDDQASKQPGSGIGKQDGSKDVKLAEQMAAMGKISEIIGKRNANVTGDVTVEVQSGNQPLKTAWVQQSAAHANASGEIHRDEVPVELQTYVQKYFEQVRKQDGSKAEGSKADANAKR
jgi:hypothetical protein